MTWDKKLTDYLKRVIENFEADNDTTKALRRLHIKEVHLTRKGNHRGLRMVKRIRKTI